MLGPVAGRVQDANAHVADADDVAVADRVERVLGLGERVDRGGNAVLEREPSVARDVVCVRVRLEHAHDPDAFLRRGFDVLLDRERGVDDHGFARRPVAEEVRAAAEVVVDELAKQHQRSR